MKVTKELFLSYVKIQKSGDFNMITDAYVVMEMLGCTQEEYSDIQANYEVYCNRFIDNNE